MTRSSSSPGGSTGGSGDDKQAGNGKKRGKLKLIAIVLVVLLAGGAVAKFTVLAPSAKASAATTAKKKPAKGPVIPMDEMTLNLANGAYLRLKISLQTTKGTSADLDTAAAAQDVIDTYSNATTAQLTGLANRTKYQDLLLKKLAGDYPKQILDVPYQEFVMTGAS
ncbi:MAG TPA: flagellar basal body-associated FliL family protein [Jatrophihabitans sp.]|nr:flagellar basal body-associated FliL family protein [Jatrophihabitans sp.]